MQTKDGYLMVGAAGEGPFSLRAGMALPAPTFDRYDPKVGAG
jgi:hypothetical protein